MEFLEEQLTFFPLRSTCRQAATTSESSAASRASRYLGSPGGFFSLGREREYTRLAQKR